MRSWLLGCALGLALASCQPAAQGGRSPAPAGPQPTAAPAADAPAAGWRPPDKIVVGYVSPSEAMVIPWLAQMTGIFARHGIEADLHMVPGTPRLVQSLVA